MRKRKNTKSQRTNKAVDYAVILLCLLGAFFSFWFFWRDLNRSIHHNQDSVGIITFKKGGAQRRLGDRVLWDRLRRESPVYDGDFIRTAELSDATVTFTEGQKFSLSENSLIQIRTVGGRAVIDLASGDIGVENTGRSVLVLVSGNRQVELSGVMKARASEDGGFELEVLEGSAVLRSGEETILQEAGQALSINAEGAVVRRPRVVMLLPRPDAQFTGTGEVLRVDFSWVPVNFTGAEHTRLEIAADRRFTHPLKRLDTESSSASADLPPGTYWWRAYAAGGNGAAGPADAFPEKLTIHPAVPEPAVPVLILPAALTAPEEAAASVPRPAAAPETPAAPRPIPATAAASVPRPVPATAAATPEPLLPAAADRRPEDNHVVGPDQIRQSRDLRFRWREVPGANGYIFTLRDAAGGELLSAGPLAETSYTLDLRRIDRGSFVWQVEAVRQNRGIIERRGTTVENRFTVDIPLPGNPRVRDPGILYGRAP
ncbi:MAG: hypothetical protein LBQ55_07230 [Treponema sp.]|jgi:hypothetical protein|nr:hypothetical protein [Treponema sp.]